MIHTVERKSQVTSWMISPTTTLITSLMSIHFLSQVTSWMMILIVLPASPMTISNEESGDNSDVELSDGFYHGFGNTGLMKSSIMSQNNGIKHSFPFSIAQKQIKTSFPPPLQQESNLRSYGDGITCGPPSAS